LWSRMVRRGKLAMIEESLTVNVFSATGMSGVYSHVQREMKSLVASANALHKQSKSDDEILVRAEKLRPSNGVKKISTKINKFSGNYFIAKVLSDNKSPYASHYWLKAFKAKPFSVVLWFSYSRYLFSKLA